MRDLSKLTAAQLLSIGEPERLYTNEANEMKAEYKFLLLSWHPDGNKHADAALVTDNVVKLYKLAQDKLSNGTWNEPPVKIEDEKPNIKKWRSLNPTDHKPIRTLRYFSQRKFELGTMYLARNYVAYEVDLEFEDLFANAVKVVSNLKYRDDAMALEMAKLLPNPVDIFRTADAKVMVVKKTPDQFLLRSVLEYMHGEIKPTGHIGWILNCLYNINCYLQYAGLTHNDISLDTVFISPLRHSAMLLGGWWYAVPEGSKFIALPERTVEMMPPDVLRNKIADYRVDLELVKGVGRELLGDKTGVKLQFNSSLNKDLVQWLNLPTAGRAVDDYRTYKRTILPKAFGPPKFVKLEMEESQVYGETAK